MTRKLAILSAVVVAFVGLGYYLYATNAAPSVSDLTEAQLADVGKPLVVKLHAQWCPICRATKDIWSRIETEYGSRVRLVVFDFTDEATMLASRERAERFGLQKFFDESQGVTGTIAVLDGHTREVKSWLDGMRKFDDYSRAIDNALSTQKAPG